MPEIQNIATQAEMRPNLASYLLELVGMDFLTVESGKPNKDVNLLVMIDHSTCYTQAYVMTSQTATTVAKTLWSKFLVHNGFLEKILTDQGHNFESPLIAELCQLAQVRKLWMTTYRPQTNGQCKHFNSLLINMIGTLSQRQRNNGKTMSHLWYMPVTVPNHLLQDIALISSCMEGNLYSQ